MKPAELLISSEVLMQAKANLSVNWLDNKEVGICHAIKYCSLCEFSEIGAEAIPGLIDYIMLRYVAKHLPRYSYHNYSFPKATSVDEFNYTQHLRHEAIDKAIIDAIAAGD